MGVLTRLASRMGYEKRADAGALNSSWAALGAGSGYFPAMSARAAENLSSVLACVNAVSTALASVPALVYRRDGAGDRIEAATHPLARMARTGVNARMSWPEFIEHMMASVLLTGNAVATIERGGNGQLSGLTFIPWSSVTVAELSSGRLAYDVADGRGASRRLLEGELLHLRDRSDDGKIGRSRLSRAGDTVSAVEAANTHARSFLQRGASPSGVIEYDGRIGEDSARALRYQFDGKFSGADKAGKTLILDSGLKWKSAQISPEDAELLETRKFGVVEICRLFQVPPPIIQAYENNTFTNAAQAGLWFATFCLAPWARKIEAEFARSVFPTGGPYEIELDLSGFLRGDPETRWNANKIAIETGVLDPDEVRQAEGWNPRPNGVRPAGPNTTARSG